jgi:hypothetical protein
VKRREFITLLGSAAVARPLIARAQQPATLPTIGFLGQSTPVVESQRLNAFLKRLRELGWIEGRTVAIEYAWGQGSSERFAEIAADFVRLGDIGHPDCVRGGGGPDCEQSRSESGATGRKRDRPVNPGD